MSWKLLNILGALALVADAPLPAMSVSWWAGCTSQGVEAANVGEHDNPEPELLKSALSLSKADWTNRPRTPVTYTILSKSTQKSYDEGKKVTWVIQCGPPPKSHVAQSEKSSENC
jgi:hypothetical protein